MIHKYNRYLKMVAGEVGEREVGAHSVRKVRRNSADAGAVQVRLTRHNDGAQEVTQAVSTLQDLLFIFFVPFSVKIVVEFLLCLQPRQLTFDYRPRMRTAWHG